jgi:YHS domain-containing protein
MLTVSCAHTGERVFIHEGSAIRGYDPVAYFTNGEPTQGKETISYQYSGATWQFATEDHRDVFVADPEKYTPQYGGFCAYAMANGFFVSTDPHAWQIHEDKLYLNYSEGVRERWRKNIPKYVAKADENWAEAFDNGQ